MLNEMNIPLEEDGIEEEILVDEEVTITKAMWGDIGGNIANQTDLQNALDAKQDSLTEAQLNAVNSGITSEKVTTYDGYADQIASKANQSALNAEATTREQADTALGRRIDDEATARQNADNGLQSQIDAITSKSDVVDVVANYAALQAYDTSTLGNNDVIKVLDDETHEDALTYYRWSTTTQTWSYIGQEAPYYSKGQMDVKLAEKQDKLTAGANIQIENGTISATDTKYTNGNGLNLIGTEFSADTDVLATKEDLEGYYTKPETDNLLAPKLEAEVVAELPTTGAEGKLYLTPKAHTTSTATGNPIEATITEQAGQLESFQLDGDTFQQSYEGKNLLKYPYSDTTKTVNGVTYTDNGDGSVTANGQATSQALFWVTREIWAYDAQNIVLQAGTYTIKGTGYPNYRVIVTLYGKTQGLITTYQVSDEDTTFTIEEETSLTVRLSIQGGASVDNYVFKPQLEAGSTATSYEPYVGGISSPSPDYPQPIQTVTGENVVKIYGKNLFNPDTPKTYGYLDSQGRLYVGGSRNEACFDYMPVKENTTYTFKIFETSDTITDTYWFGIGAYSSASESGFISMPFRWWAETRPYVTFTTPTGCNYIRISGRYLLHATKLQLELGSTATTTYEPYQYRSFPLDLGAIELCKLSTYQDYIWKDGEDWKVHKATKKISITGGFTKWTSDGVDGYYNNSIVQDARQAVGEKLYVSTHYGAIPVINGSMVDFNSYVSSNSIEYGIGIKLSMVGLAIRDKRFSTAQSLNDWLAENPVTMYYALLLSQTTDTTITDTALIAQLEAIRTASLQNGTSIIESTGTGSNLAGDMEIGYYGFAPRNRYDKFIWLNINNEYEQIADAVSVDAIQYNPNMRSVAHQGFSTTSETYGNCRLSSYVGAKQHGFDFAECDLQWTSDMIPVCSHDASFNSNGTTVVIADHTLAELKTYSYFGETIASFEEVLAKCKSLGLGLYIDKSWFDQTHFNIIAAIVDKYQMQDNVYWLLQGAVQPTFDMINNWYPNAKYSVVLNTGTTAPTEAQIQAVVDFANQNKTVNNYISIDVNHNHFTVEQLASLSAQLTHGVQLECWTIDNATRYKEVLPYLCAITSNKISYNDVYEDL